MTTLTTRGRWVIGANLLAGLIQVILVFVNLPDGYWWLLNLGAAAMFLLSAVVIYRSNESHVPNLN